MVFPQSGSGLQDIAIKVIEQGALTIVLDHGLGQKKLAPRLPHLTGLTLSGRTGRRSAPPRRGVRW